MPPKTDTSRYDLDFEEGPTATLHDESINAYNRDSIVGLLALKIWPIKRGCREPNLCYFVRQILGGRCDWRNGRQTTRWRNYNDDDDTRHRHGQVDVA